MTTSTAPKITLVVNPVPYRHPAVIPSDLKDGMIMTADEIVEAVKFLQDKADGPYDFHSKKILKIKDQYYAIYKALDEEKGSTADKIYLAQQLTSDGKGKWDIIKAQKNLIVSKQETHILQRINRRAQEAKQGNIHFIVMEEAPGVKLTNLVRDKFTMPQWLELIMKMIENVKILHSQFKILHRDIKLGNFNFDTTTGQATLFDFGISIEMNPSGGIVKGNERLGSPGYMAPEVMSRYEFSTQSDIYALGKSIAYLLGFEKENPSSKLDAHEKIPHKTIRDQIKKFLEKMTHSNPTNRPSLDECLRFFNTLYEQLLKFPYANVGFLDLSEFKTTRDQQSYIDALQYVDEVWFLDLYNEYRSDDDLISLRHHLESNGIRVGNKLISTNEEKLDETDVMALMIQRTDHDSSADRDNKMRNYFYVTSNPALSDAPHFETQKGACLLRVDKEKTDQDYKKDIDDYLKKHPLKDRHRQLILETLQEELQRFEKKYKNVTKEDAIHKKASRIKALENTIDFFNNTENINYTNTFKVLSELQAAMLSTPMGVLSKVKGEKKIRQLKEKVEQEFEEHKSTRLRH